LNINKNTLRTTAHEIHMELKSLSTTTSFIPIYE
jgi:hypothetical protein